ncbi:MAG: phosphatidylserine/phosphatidylglycerophosphate/cardiolipin synthase family protein [Candidatus Nanopelagicales bacterium]
MRLPLLRPATLTAACAAAVLLLAGCGSAGTGSASSGSAGSGSAAGATTGSASPSVEMPTASYTPPADDQVTPAQDIVLNSIEPDAGVAPVVDFLNSATTSIDISTYRIDSTFTPVVDALKAAVARGVPVRVSISRQLVGQSNPAEGNASQVQVAEQLNALGIQTQLSRPEFHYGHEKAIIIDAGQPTARAMISDWNLQASYFGPNAYGPVGARGFAVVDSNAEDLATISAYFNANWPPFAPWPVSNRASLLWSPSGIEYSPVGNSVAALTDFIDNSKKTLDIYAETIQDDSFLLQHVADRAKAGVKVRVIANSSGQPPAAIETLRKAGAEVKFDPTNAMTPDAVMYVHSKSMVADYGQSGQVAFVGSQNQFINESLEAILELGTLVKDGKAIDQIHSTFDTDFNRSQDNQASASPSSSGTSQSASGAAASATKSP